MRTFFIYPNLRKQSAREILPSVCEQLRGREIRLILPNQMRGTMHALHDEVMALDYMDTAEAVRIADAAVVLGGDGTMLRIARAAAQNELPLLGINVGHVGFMTELVEIMEWTKTHVHSTLHICWGAQAGLYYHYGIPKYELSHKMSGIFKHHVLFPHEPLMRGFDDLFCAPHSRHTEVRADDIRKHSELRLLAESHEAGVYIVEAVNGRQIFILGHGEYDSDTLKKEYERDLAKGLNPDVPKHYFRNDDPSADVLVTWKAHAHLFYTNWINYYVYQTTPFQLEKL